MRCLTKKIKKGDFSFIDDPIERKSIEFDYLVYNRIKKSKITDIIGFMNYSEESYSRNIKYLAFIEKHGWESFLKNYPQV